MPRRSLKQEQRPWLEAEGLVMEHRFLRDAINGIRGVPRQEPTDPAERAAWIEQRRLSSAEAYNILVARREAGHSKSQIMKTRTAFMSLEAFLEAHPDVVLSTEPADATADPYERLRASAEGKQASRWQIAHWVTQHYKRDLDRIDPDLIPDESAVNLLEMCRQDEAFAKAFFKDTFKLTASRAEERPAAAGGDTSDEHGDALRRLQELCG